MTSEIFYWVIPQKTSSWKWVWVVVFPSPDQLFSDLQQGPSVAEMMVCLGPMEINHRFQKLLQVCESS